MMLTSTIDGFQTLIANLASPALRALALALGAAIALAAFQGRSTSLRLFTWTAVLYAALAMPFLGRMLPPLSVPAPAFLQPAAPQSDAVSPVPAAFKAVAPSSHANRILTRTAHSPSVVSTTSAVTAAPSHRISISWTAVATLIYFAVALLLLVRIGVGLFFGRRLMRVSHTIRDPRVTTRLVSRAYAWGLSFVPRAAESELISVPVTMSIFRPAILFPAGWCEWDDAKLDAVIAHEVSHVARRDALTQRLSLLHRAIFWFSPLAWWLDRHLADLAEQASDEAALSCGADRNDYARTLLGFFEALHVAPGRVWWQGVSMAKPGQAEQRLERILAWRGVVTMGLKKSVTVAIIACAIPVVYLAASVRPASANQQVQTPTLQSAAPAAPSAPPQAGSEPDPALAPSAPAMTLGVAAIAPIAPIAPTSQRAMRAALFAQLDAARDRHSRSSYSVGNSYAYGYDDEERFVIVSGKTDSYTMSGSTSDVRHVEKLKKQISGDFIWFQRDEKSYIIRDQATIERARKFWEPQEELGKKQEELGKLQEELGKQQEAIGKKMDEVQVKVPDMTAELDKLKAKLQKMGSTATMEQIGDLQSEIGELQSKIGEIQSHAGDQQGKLGEEMGALGEKQGKLGEQQGKLGEEQGELAEQAAKQMKQLLDEAIKNGKAQPEPESGGPASL